MANLLWLQSGACSGNTMSFLNAEEPSVCDLVTGFGIKIVWGCPAHPDWITQILVALATGSASDVALDDLQRPKTFFMTLAVAGR
jgi:uptake hydrogenase small subunit